MTLIREKVSNRENTCTTATDHHKSHVDSPRIQSGPGRRDSNSCVIFCNYYLGQTDRQTDSHTDRQTDRQTHSHTHKQTDRHTVTHTNTQTDTQSHTVTHTNTQTDRQTDRHTVT